MGTIFMFLHFIAVSVVFFLAWYTQDIMHLITELEVDMPDRNTLRTIITWVVKIILLVVYGIIVVHFFTTYNLLFRILMIFYLIALFITNAVISFSRIVGEMCNIRGKIKHIVANISFYNFIFMCVVLVVSGIAAMLVTPEKKLVKPATTTTIEISCGDVKENNTKVDIAEFGANQKKLYFIASYNENSHNLPNELEDDECEITFLNNDEAQEKLIVTEEIFKYYTWIYKENVPKSEDKKLTYNFYVKLDNLKAQ